MTDRLSTVELAVFERLLDVGDLLYRQADDQMRAASDATGRQYEILIRLRNAGGEMRMNELAGSMTRTPSGLTYQLRQLEQRGYAKRARVTHDERGVLARITEAGRQFIRDQHDARVAFVRTRVINSFTPEEVDTLFELLGRVQLSVRGATTGGITPEMAELMPRARESTGAPTAAPGD